MNLLFRALALLTEKPNEPNIFGWTPIQLAAIGGHEEIITFLAPFTENPNAPISDGWTPIQMASRDGHLGVVKVLSSYVDKPNAPAPNGWTPIQLGKLKLSTIAQNLLYNFYLVNHFANCRKIAKI